ncbi:MAG: DUF411 domain-containing protein [Magnetovibrionaceae bacterium]
MLNVRAMFASAAFVLAFSLGGLTWADGPTASSAPQMTVYKSPSCGCCGKWVEHMEENGFQVTVKNTDDLDPIKFIAGVPDKLQSCHTATIDGYVIEGHVPAADVKRLLAERPAAVGLSVPGMPIGSPGMEMGDEKEPYPVILFNGEDVSIYNRY